MKLFQRVFLSALLCLVIAAPVLADSKEATISLSRTPEPPFCAIPGQTSVQASWNITYATTPNFVRYYLQDPTRLINLEYQQYPFATGVNITRNWPVPPGSVDGKYWIRVEFWSFEAGNEANAEVTFYVCAETGTICATKLADTNCNGQLDPGVDQPIPGWWLCLHTPLGDDYCLQTDATGRACWSGIPLGAYTVYEAPMAGWEPIGPVDYNVTLVDGTPQSFTFLNRNLADCYHACCLPNGNCVVLLQVDCEVQGGVWQSSPTCVGVNCPQPTGACCDFATGACTITTAALCLPPNVWLGPGSLCNDQTCPVPPPTGACCDFATGACTITTAALCLPPSVWLGPGSLCNDQTCPVPPPTGACCDYATGACSITTAPLCLPPSVWLGAGSLCNDQTCPVPPPMGACCDHATGACTITQEALCLPPSVWLGAGVPCNDVTCAPPVPTERTSWGQIKNIYR